MVVDLERLRNEYHRVEDRLYRLRCHYGYSSLRNRAFKRLEQRAQKLNRILRHMEANWGLRRS